MRFHTIAVSTVLAVTGVGLAGTNPAMAQGGDLYVNASTPSCSNSGPGSSTWPLCTIQAAADIVQPGQTVHVSGVPSAEQVRLTRSGTPDAPITFTGSYQKVGSPQSVGGFSLRPTTGPALTITGAHDVVVDGFDLNNPGTIVAVADSARITVKQSYIGLGNMPFVADTPTVSVTGSSRQVTLAQNFITHNSRQQILIGPGVSGTVVAGNEIQEYPYTDSDGSTVTAIDAPGTVLNGNTVLNECGSAIRLNGSSTDSVVENNVVSADTSILVPCDSVSDGGLIGVDASATEGTVVDYNVVYPGMFALAPYKWAGTEYSTPAALQSVTGQGAHDVKTNPKLVGFTPQSDSPVVDSGNADAPGTLAVDLRGHPRLDDPLVANTGSGTGAVDRGALELGNPFRLGNITLSTTKSGPYPLQVSATVDVLDQWSTGASYSFDFGDGSAPVVTSSPTATHTYTQASRQTLIKVTATAPGTTSTQEIYGPSVTTPGPLTPRLNLVHSAPDAPLAIHADTTGSTDPWQITEIRVDFGDGTPEYVSTYPGQPDHFYAQPGTYTVKLTEKDELGATATTSGTVTVGGSYVNDGPQRVLDTRSGVGARAGILPARGTVRLKVTGSHGVPAYGVTSVVLNLTATAPTGSGFVTAHSGGTATPNVSSLNYLRGQTLSNLVSVPVAADGTIALTASAGSAVHLVADLLGYYTKSAGHGATRYAATDQRLLLDTRVPNPIHSNVIGPGQTLTVPVPIGQGGLPGATSLAVLRVTATEPNGPGYLTAYAADAARPNTSTVNFTKGQTVSNLVVTPVAPDGTVRIYNHAAVTHVLVSLVGSFDREDGGVLRPAPVTSSFTSVGPKRLLDTRVGTGAPARRLVPGQQLALKVAGTGGVPAAATAVLVNLTATASTGPGFLTTFANGSPLPTTVSTLNFVTGQTVPTLTVVPVGPGGYIRIYNHSPGVHVLADIQGYFMR